MAGEPESQMARARWPEPPLSTPAIAREPDGRTRGSCTLWKPRCPQRLLAEATGRSSGQPEARPGDVREPPESQLAGVETAVARASASWRSGGSLTAPGRACLSLPGAPASLGHSPFQSAPAGLSPHRALFSTQAPHVRSHVRHVREATCERAAARVRRHRHASPSPDPNPSPSPSPNPNQVRTCMSSLTLTLTLTLTLALTLTRRGRTRRGRRHCHHGAPRAEERLGGGGASAP